MDEDFLGPEVEQTALTRRESTSWWQILTWIFREEQAGMGAVRPSFSERANQYLKTNGSRDRAQ